jgi:hypothetical protein
VLAQGEAGRAADDPETQIAAALIEPGCVPSSPDEHAAATRERGFLQFTRERVS